MRLKFASRVSTTLALIGLLTGITLAALPAAQAAKIEKVKGKRVLIDSEGEALSVGQVYAVRDSNGKSVGLIKITKVGSARAVAVLGKGSARPGQSIQLRQKSTAQRAKKSSSSGASSSTSTSYIGGMAGVSMAKADVDLFDAGGNATGSVSLDGNGFSAKGLYDYPLFSTVWFRGLLGVEQFNVAGGSNTACSGKCETEIMYLTFDFWARFLLSQSVTTRPWLGVGGALLFPVSKSSSALKESSITNTNIFAFGGGLDFFLSEKTYIPVQIEYNMYPKSDTVKASAIAIRGGFAIQY